MFEGSLKNNLDPLEKCTDEELWNVIKQVKLDKMFNERERLNTKI